MGEIEDRDHDESWAEYCQLMSERDELAERLGRLLSLLPPEMLRRVARGIHIDCGRCEFGQGKDAAGCFVCSAAECYPAGDRAILDRAADALEEE